MTPTLDFAAIREFISKNAESAQEISLKVLSGVKAGGMILLSILINLALIPVVMFYLLRDWRMIFERLDDLLPRHWQGKVRAITGDIDAVLAEFLRGQGMVMIVLATYYAIGLSIAGLDRAFSIGILTGLLVFIPYVGFGLGLVLGVVAAALQWHGWPGFLAVLAVYGIGQLLENYRAAAVSGRRPHRSPSARGDLRAAGVRPALRVHGRAAGPSRIRGAAGRLASPACCIRDLAAAATATTTATERRGQPA
jgi:hypothetical protein